MCRRRRSCPWLYFVDCFFGTWNCANLLKKFIDKAHFFIFIRFFWWFLFTKFYTIVTNHLITVYPFSHPVRCLLIPDTIKIASDTFLDKPQLSMMVQFRQLPRRLTAYFRHLLKTHKDWVSSVQQIWRYFLGVFRRGNMMPRFGITKLKLNSHRPPVCQKPWISIILVFMSPS